MLSINLSECCCGKDNFNKVKNSHRVSVDFNPLGNEWFDEGKCEEIKDYFARDHLRC
jgi:hypothetical protein